MVLSCGGKVKKITSVLSKRWLSAKRDRLWECILVLLSTDYFAKQNFIRSSILLDYRQRIYTYWLLSLLDLYLAKEILPISLRKGDRGFQPGELPENTLLWTQDSRSTLYGQWLELQITIDHSFDPAEGLESVEMIASNFKANVIVKCKKIALEEARKDKTGLVL